MAYATLADVIALNSARVYSATSHPATSAVGQFIDQQAAAIDAILLEKGYTLPVPTTASSALLMLQHINAVGAWSLSESGAERSPYRDLALTMWQASIDMLKAQSTVLDIPKSGDRASPRGPGVSRPAGPCDQPFDPVANVQFDHFGNPIDNGSPLFTRAQQF